MGFPALIEPLIQRVRDQSSPTGVLLAVHDWSTPAFATHRSRTDRRQVTHATDIGYDLATVLIVRGSDGASLAPVSVSLATDKAILSTRPDPVDDAARVEPIRSRMDFVATLNLGADVVHVIDREANSLGHWRDGSAAGHHALVRTDDRLVVHDGRERKLLDIAAEVTAQDGRKVAGEAWYHGREAWRFVGETEVVLHRPAKRRAGGKQHEVRGERLGLRLVVAERRDVKGGVRARWLLLTNATPQQGDAATVASRYYWRWNIENLHKLLESAGGQLESWLQRSGERLLRKLLVAMAARVEVWDLERRTDDASESFKRLLMGLSGRQTKARRPVTTTALLAGLWVLQQAATWLARDGPDDPNALLKRHLPLFAQCSDHTADV